MNLNRFIIPTATGLLIGSVVFDTFFAESTYPDADIKISPHVSRVVASGETYFIKDDEDIFQEPRRLCDDIPVKTFKKLRNPDHRLTLTEDMDLQFTIKADYKDPVIYILSNKRESNKRELCAIQQNVEKSYEGFHSTIVWSADMPNGTYLMWIFDPHKKDKINNYELTIDIEEREDE